MKNKNFLKQCAKRKYSANKTLALLKKKGKGYNRKKFLADYRWIKKTPIKKEATKYTPTKYALQYEPGIINDPDVNFRYHLKGHFLDEEDQFITIESDEKFSKAKLIQEGKDIWGQAELYQLPIHDLEEVEVVDAIRRANPKESETISKKAKARARKEYTKKSLKRDLKDLERMEKAMAKKRELIADKKKILGV